MRGVSPPGPVEGAVEAAVKRTCGTGHGRRARSAQPRVSQDSRRTRAIPVEPPHRTPPTHGSGGLPWLRATRWAGRHCTNIGRGVIRVVGSATVIQVSRSGRDGRRRWHHRRFSRSIGRCLACTILTAAALPGFSNIFPLASRPGCQSAGTLCTAAAEHKRSSTRPVAVNGARGRQLTGRAVSLVPTRRR